MKFKRIFRFVAGLFLIFLLSFGWIKYNEGGPVPYPINTGSFFVVGSATVDPTTLLEDAKSGNNPLLTNIQPELPEDISFITTVGWSQSDYLRLAEAFHKEIWGDDPNEWHLYRILFYTSCKNLSRKFENADFYYFREIRDDGKRMYSVRNILIEPEYRYVAWGGDTLFPRPLLGWAEIGDIANVSAEKALEMADQQGGDVFRNQQNNDCRISVSMWPWGFSRDEWKVRYSGNIESTKTEFWIPK